MLNFDLKKNLKKLKAEYVRVTVKIKILYDNICHFYPPTANKVLLDINDFWPSRNVMN